MDRSRLILKHTLAWGFGLWLFGYVLGFVFFALVPAGVIGWYIMPLGLAATALALWRWVRVSSFTQGLLVGGIWCALAIVLDYLLIVKLLAPADGYYKADVYFYYASTLVLPVIAAGLRMSGAGGKH